MDSNYAQQEHISLKFVHTVVNLLAGTSMNGSGSLSASKLSWYALPSKSVKYAEGFLILPVRHCTKNP